MIPAGEQRSQRIWTGLAIAVVGAGLLLRLLGLHRGLWLDEYTTLLQLDPHDTLETLARVRTDTHHPLYFALLGLWAKFGTSLPYLRLLGVVIDGVTMTALLLWLRRVSPLGALLATLYVATAPLYVRFGLELRPYGILTCTTVLVMWTTHALAANGQTNRRYALWSAALAALIAAHPIGVMFVPVVTGWLVVTLRPARYRAMAVALLPSIILFALLHWVYQKLSSLSGIAWMPHMSWALVLHTLIYMEAVHFARLSPVLRIVSSAVLGAWLAVLLTHRQSRAWYLAIWGLAFFAMVAVYSAMGTPIFWYRSLMPAGLCFCVFIAVHTATLKSGWRRSLGVVGLVSLCGLQAMQSLTTINAPVEPSPEVGTVLRREWSTHSMALYYPDYMGASIRAEADGIPPSAIDSLIAPQEPTFAAFTDNVFVAVRVDLDVAKAPDKLALDIEKRMVQIPGAHAMEIMLIPGHDLEVINDTRAVSAVVSALSRRFGAAEALPPQGELERWRFSVVN